MKTKNKLLALVGIAVVVCSLLLVAIPAIAAEQSQEVQEVSATASEDDYVLGIYGNANEDDTIDMRDLTYVKLIFFGKKPVTELADAKYDGKVNPLDFIQIKLIIVGKEKELTIVDTVGRNVTIDKPLERIIVLNRNTVEMMRSLNLEKERIVSVSTDVLKKEIFFPEFKDCPSVGSARSPDIEKILELKPDAVFIYATTMTPTWVQEKLEDAGIIVVRFDCFKPETYVEEADKLGYIFGKRDEEVDNFIEFYEGCLNSIKEKVEEIPEDEKTKIYIERFRTPYSTSGKGVALHQIIELAGGNNIFSDLSGHINVDPEEVIIRNPIIIVKQAYARTEYGYNVDDTKGLKDVRDEIMGRPELGDVSAVKNKKVYVVIKEITGGKHFIAIGYMAKWFYPDIFEDLDPEAIHQEYLTRFQGLDFDLDEHGVFVYPLLED